MRESLSLHRELAQKLSAMEQRLDGHDEAIQELFEAIRQLLEPPAAPHREIGFHMREQPVRYRIPKLGRTR